MTSTSPAYGRMSNTDSTGVAGLMETPGTAPRSRMSRMRRAGKRVLS